MTCTAQNLAAMAPDIEAQLKPNLRGLLGGIVRGYLPQTWVFVTGQDTASIVVNQNGDATVHEGAAPNPDLTILVDHDRLAVALRTRDAKQVPPGPPPQVTFHTKKGQTAWNFLRGRFGL